MPGLFELIYGAVFVITALFVITGTAFGYISYRNKGASKLSGAVLGGFSGFLLGFTVGMVVSTAWIF